MTATLHGHSIIRVLGNLSLFGFGYLPVLALNLRITHAVPLHKVQNFLPWRQNIIHLLSHPYSQALASSVCVLILPPLSPKHTSFLTEFSHVFFWKLNGFSSLLHDA